jgi:hypothetical protein
VSWKTQERCAVRKWKVDASESPCRGAFKTAINGYGRKPVVANVMVKGRDNDQIDRSNVKRLVPIWNLSLDSEWGEQVQPLVYDGVM